MTSPCKDSDKLKKILSKLSYLDLSCQITSKRPYASDLGSTCEVFSAWSQKHGKNVAVKQIRAFLLKDFAFANRLAKEIRIWATLNHCNILPLWGFVVEGDNAMPSLISEWMFKGTMFDFMKTFPKSSITSCKLLQGVAEGLAYLHSERVIHADLKTQNILISENDEPLLTDFGLSLALTHSTLVTSKSSYATKGTIRWMARELVDPGFDGPSIKHNEKTDIWAFGMVVYEMLTWKVPYWNIPIDVRVILQISKGELPQKPLKFSQTIINNDLWYLCEACWAIDSLRPSAKQISDRLVNTIEDDVSVKFTYLRVPGSTKNLDVHVEHLMEGKAEDRVTSHETGVLEKLQRLCVPGDEILSIFHQGQNAKAEALHNEGDESPRCLKKTISSPSSTSSIAKELWNGASKIQGAILKHSDEETSATPSLSFRPTVKRPSSIALTPASISSSADIFCTCGRARDFHRSMGCRDCLHDFHVTCNDIQVDDTTNWACRSCKWSRLSDPPENSETSTGEDQGWFLGSLLGVSLISLHPPSTSSTPVPEKEMELSTEPRIAEVTDDVPTSCRLPRHQTPPLVETAPRDMKDTEEISIATNDDSSFHDDANTKSSNSHDKSSIYKEHGARIPANLSAQDHEDTFDVHDNERPLETRDSFGTGPSGWSQSASQGARTLFKSTDVRPSNVVSPGTGVRRHPNEFHKINDYDYAPESQHSKPLCQECQPRSFKYCPNDSTVPTPWYFAQVNQAYHPAFGPPLLEYFTSNAVPDAHDESHVQNFDGDRGSGCNSLSSATHLERNNSSSSDGSAKVHTGEQLTLLPYGNRPSPFCGEDQHQGPPRISAVDSVLLTSISTGISAMSKSPALMTKCCLGSVDDRMLDCSVCGQKFHPNCLSRNKHADKIEDQELWRCIPSQQPESTHNTPSAMISEIPGTADTPRACKEFEKEPRQLKSNTTKHRDALPPHPPQKPPVKPTYPTHSKHTKTMSSIKLSTGHSSASAFPGTSSIPPTSSHSYFEKPSHRTKVRKAPKMDNNLQSRLNVKACGYCQEHHIKCDVGPPYSKHLCKKCQEMRYSRCPPAVDIKRNM